MEEWRKIEGWDGYEVSSFGQVRSWKVCRRSPLDALPRPVAPWVLPNGYHQVKLKDKGRKCNMYVHRAVMTAFVGPCPEGNEVAHWDGNKGNNKLENLRYATPVENAVDMLRHGNRQMGEKHYSTKVTTEQAAEVLAFVGTHADAARHFGISYPTVYSIRVGTHWTQR